MDYTVAGFKKEFASMNSPYNLMGIVFNNMVTGERMKVRNPNYELVKNAKGVENKLMLQYLSLRHGGRVAEYLKSFPEYKSNFSVYRNSVHAFTKNLHQNYLDCFVFKKKPFGELPQQYKKYIIQLNKKYIDELRENRNCVTFNYVMEFVNKVEPGALLFSLNYVVREHKKVIQRLEEPIEKVVSTATAMDTVEVETTTIEKVKQE
jgi:hemerythrin superfamily protein